jgi:hypothetical protein
MRCNEEKGGRVLGKAGWGKKGKQQYDCMKDGIRETKRKKRIKDEGKKRKLDL